MQFLRVIGMLIGVVIGAYSVYKYRKRRYSKIDFLLGLVLAAGLIVISVNPGVGDIPARVLGMQTRWFAVLFISNLFLFFLFLYVLNKANQANRSIGWLVRSLATANYRETFERKGEEKSIFVIMPAYNEEEAIAGVLKRIPVNLYGYAVYPIVVVDGATDSTEDVVRRDNYLVATHLINRGQGDALRTGFAIALQEGADIVMTMDADGQHRVEDMDKLVKPIIDGDADLVLGSRFRGEYADSGGMRHLGIVIFTVLLNLLARTKITDCTNGFRSIRGLALAQLELRERRFSAPEIILEASRKGLRIEEVPVTIVARSAGESKKPPGFHYPFGFLKTIIKVWLR